MIENNARVLVITAGLVTAAMLVVGLATGLRTVMHASLLLVAVAAFLPFVILGGLLLLVIVVLLFAALSESDPDGLLDGALFVGEVSPGIRGYYRFLGRRRHLVFWGVPIGMVVGALVCWAVLGITVVPKEVATTRRLAEVFEAIEAQDAVPEPTRAGELLLDREVVVDGFERPLRYETRGRWKLRVWSARSAGADGQFDTPDDLCISGRTALVGRIADLVDGVSEPLEGVLAMRCDS
jgi:hypothetical protein